MGYFEKKYAWLFLVLGAVCWSMAGVFVKSTSWNPVSIATVRGTFSFLVFLSFRLILKPGRIVLTKAKILGAVCYFLQGILIVTANKLTTAGNASLLQNTAPMFLMVLNLIFLRQIPSRRDILTCAVLTSGIALCCLGNAGSGKITGDVIAVISGIFYAGVFFADTMGGADAMESLILGNSLYLPLVPFLWTDAAFRHSTGKDIGSVLAFCLISGTIAWFLFSRGIRHTPSLRASFVTMLEPVLAPVWTLIFLRERMSPLCIVGFFVVIGTLIVYNFRRIREVEEPSRQISQE
ncbi:MAG: DMT family transporter [Clostridia bacterium]|nr:DMT family transporter [Clostridia bacterium]